MIFVSVDRATGEKLVLTETEYYGLVRYLYEDQYRPASVIRLSERVTA